MERTLREDESLFGGGIESDPPNETFENASLAAFNRGVDIRWLELFTNFHNCWSWPTWRVVQNIIKPATAHSRVRYVDLPGVATAANVGKVNIFISHAWGGCFGDLVSSALYCLGKDDNLTEDDKNVKRPSNVVIRVYVDIFAVRQWPGNVNDVVFQGIVKRVDTVLVVASSRELRRVANLDFRTINEKGIEALTDEERRAVPFLRIWCLAEINSAVVQNKRLVVACGAYMLDAETKTTHTFEHNAALLYHMQFLVSVESSKAQYIEDQTRILNEVQNGVGYDAVNRSVRGAICGAMVSSKCATVRLASVGNRSKLEDLLNSCFLKGDASLIPKVHDALFAIAASGFCDLFDLVMKYNTEAGTGQFIFPLTSMKDADGATILMHAVKGGQERLVHMIAEECDDEVFNAMDNSHWTSLAYAAQFGCDKILQTLLSREVDVNTRVSGGHIALSVGLQSNFSLACCRLLIGDGSDVHNSDAVGYTALRHAVVPGINPDLTIACLDAGADPNAVDNWGQTILHWAVQDGTVRSARALLEYDYRAKEERRRRELKCQEESSDLSFIHERAQNRKLIPIEVNQLDFKCGRSALDIAIGKGSQEVIKLLRAYGALTAAEMMEQNGQYGCGKILEFDLQTVMKLTGASREHAGLMLTVSCGNINTFLGHIQTGRSFPEPLDACSMDLIIDRSNLWPYGIVIRGEDWRYGDDDGGDGSVGLLSINFRDVNAIRSKTANVFWPKSKKTFQVRLGAEGKFDIRYAPYTYVI